MNHDSIEAKRAEFHEGHTGLLALMTTAAFHTAKQVAAFAFRKQEEVERPLTDDEWARLQKKSIKTILKTFRYGIECHDREETGEKDSSRKENATPNANEMPSHARLENPRLCLYPGCKATATEKADHDDACAKHCPEADAPCRTCAKRGRSVA